MKLFATGVSYRTAPVELRERLAVQRNQLVDLAHYLKLFGNLDEVVLLSTCNRVEIYGTAKRAKSDINALFQLFCSKPRDLSEHIYVHENENAVRHLFRVAAGLDSMVLGETDIMGQVKSAYELARTAELTGPILNRLFQKAFQTTKEIRTFTGVGRGTVSIKSAAAELIGKTGDLSQQSIMVLGAGMMAESCLRLLVSKGAKSIFVTSRSFDRAIDVAARCGGEAVCFGYSLFEMREVDVVIAATSSTETLLNAGDIKNLMEARRDLPLLLIDLSVPRNIDPAAGELDNVTLYNIDDLAAIGRRSLQARQRELAACHQIIEAAIAPLIEKLDPDRQLCRHERIGRSSRSNHPFEVIKDSPYELPRVSGLVIQPS
jgi:glutamyl-tRNA reductase